MTRLDDLERKALATRKGRDRMKEVFRAKGLTIAAASQKMKEHTETVSRVLGGERSPRAHRIREKIAKLLGVARIDVDRTLDGEPDHHTGARA